MMPNNPQIAAYTFAPQQPQQPQQQRETQKNYVFVDEHNRHKRLKVMRACEGCRRRKIKCDAATTNTWPCSACIRLKLHCVKPNGFDGADTTTYKTTTALSSSTNATAPAPAFLEQDLLQTSFSANPAVPVTGVYQQQPQYDSSHLYDQLNFQDQSLQQDPTMSGTSLPQMPSSIPDSSFTTQQHGQSFFSVSGPMGSSVTGAGNMYPVTPPGISQPPPQSISLPSMSNYQPTPPAQTHAQFNDMNSPAPSTQTDYTSELVKSLGNLEINPTGTAPYLRNKASLRHEEPPPEEDEDDEIIQSLPPMRAGKIRVPPELMPTEEQSLRYFKLYFQHIHPYLPVLSKPLFYEQWQNNRQSISPLVLEVLFAFGSRLADEGSGGQQWLALATKHVDIFMDVPRLSTLQAVMMLMKARESVPQKGYYYRSWMNIVAAIQMARELGLDDHSENHNAGKPCDFSLAECRLKTRLWQIVYVLETMIGSSQGRTQLSIDSAQVDMQSYTPVRSEDPGEYIISRNFTYFARLVREIGHMNVTYGRMKKKMTDGSWATDPEFLKHGPALNTWYMSLADGLTVTFPADNTPPVLPSAFTGNLLTYYFLSFILLHRPQLSLCDPNGAGGRYKKIMMVCSASAKNICKLHESVMNQFGLIGLQGMLRGYSYVVYCGLSSIVIHLAALTSPDPEISADAGEFFSRHMRLLEEIMANWSIPDVKKQIDALRRAFSADIRKPFVLKPSFPYGSPASSHSSPPTSPPENNYKKSPGSMPASMDSIAGANFGHLTTPMHSATNMQNHNNIVMQQGSQASSMNASMSMNQTPVWNPNPIFEQWNTAFGQQIMHSPAGSGSPSSQNMNNSPSNMDMASLGMTASSTISASQAMPAPNFPATTQFMTPEMWQQSVASVYEGGLKRPWDYNGGSESKR